MYKICSICRKRYEGFGNNAEPVRKKPCCDNCNLMVVIPIRMRQIELGKIKQKEIGDDLPKCPKCGEILREIWENNGFNPPDPTHYEMVGYRCKEHGEIEPNEEND